MIINFVLSLSLLISFYTDIKNRKILNLVTIPTIFFGILHHTFNNGLEGFAYSSYGFVIGFSILLIPYLLGGMGAGDVKLMGAIGSLMGAAFIIKAFIFIAIIGGLISLILILKQKGIMNSLKSFYILIPLLRGNLGSLILESKNNNEKIIFPYGVPIVLGTICAVIWGV